MLAPLLVCIVYRSHLEECSRSDGSESDDPDLRVDQMQEGLTGRLFLRLLARRVVADLHAVRVFGGGTPKNMIEAANPNAFCKS